MQCEDVKIERMHKKLPASQLHRNPSIKKLHLVAEAVSANPGNESSSVLSVSSRGTSKTLPTSLIRTRFQVVQLLCLRDEGRNLLTECFFFQTIQGMEDRKYI